MTRRAVSDARPGCPSRLHDTRSAKERQGCTCPAAAVDAWRGRKLRREAGQVRTATVPAIGTARRLQALAAAGWSSIAVADRLGLDHGHLRHVRAGDWPTVASTVAGLVSAAYPLMVRLPTPTARPSARARLAATVAGNGWLPPAAWAGRDIDDPTVRPHAPGPRWTRAAA